MKAEDFDNLQFDNVHPEIDPVKIETEEEDTQEREYDNQYVSPATTSASVNVVYYSRWTTAHDRRPTAEPLRQAGEAIYFNCHSI